MKNEKLKIVCGTDFSRPAMQASTAAAAIAIKGNETLVLAHIMEPPAVEYLGQEVLDAVVSKGRERLREEAARLRKLGAKVEEYFAIGSPYELLVDFVRQNSTRMILLGSTKRSAPLRWFVGSVAERVAEHASVPTVVVRDAAILESWASGSRPLKIFVAADFSHASEAPLLWVQHLQKVGPCSLTVAYVNWIPEENTRLGVHGPVSFLENSPEVQAILERDLRAKVEKLLGSKAVKVTIEPGWGRTDAHLVEMAVREEADLIVVGAHQRSGAKRIFAESVSRGVLHRSPTSVAIVPASMAPPLAEEPLRVTKKVLVTTDFSELGNQAIPHAYSLLGNGGEVSLVHVVEPFQLPNPLIASYRPSHMTKRQFASHVQKITKQLQSLIPKDAESRGIRTEIHVVEDFSPAAGVCQAAERFGADVICIASHGRSGIARAVLGSVAQAVLAKSHRPLLVVRPPQE